MKQLIAAASFLLICTAATAQGGDTTRNRTTTQAGNTNVRNRSANLDSTTRSMGTDYNRDTTGRPRRIGNGMNTNRTSDTMRRGGVGGARRDTSWSNRNGTWRNGDTTGRGNNRMRSDSTYRTVRDSIGGAMNNSGMVDTTGGAPAGTWNNASVQSDTSATRATSVTGTTATTSTTTGTTTTGTTGTEGTKVKIKTETPDGKETKTKMKDGKVVKTKTKEKDQ